MYKASTLKTSEEVIEIMHQVLECIDKLFYELFYSTIFRLWCKSCKQISRIHSYKIRLYTNTPSPFYTFKCKDSHCKAINKKPANKRAIEALTDHGAEHYTTPPPKHLTKINAPPLTKDDIIDLHFVLEKGGIVEQVRKLGRRNGGSKNE